MKSNLLLLRTISSIADEFKLGTTLKLEVEAKKRDVQRLTDVLINRDGKLQNLILEASVLIRSLAEQHENNSRLEIDHIFLEDSEVNTKSSELRAGLSDISKLLSFAYCSSNFDAISPEHIASIYTKIDQQETSSQAPSNMDNITNLMEDKLG